MSRTNGLQEPVFASEGETPTLKRLERILNSKIEQAKLVGVDGEEIILPDSVYSVLRQVIELMVSGRAAFLVPLEHELTTQEAAEILNISRPYLVKLLEQGAIAYRMVGSHRRIRFEDLIAYKEQRDDGRRANMRKLTQLSEELGLYDEEDQCQEAENLEQ